MPAASAAGRLHVERNCFLTRIPPAPCRHPSRSPRTCALAALALLLATPAPLCAAETHAAGRLIASKEPGWPQWRGPRRDGISDETGLLKSWPEGGPKLLWTVSGLGRGYSAPIITHGTLYITGDLGRELHIFAFSLDGKPKWRTKNGQAWRRSVPGCRACCAYDGGRLFHANAHGRVVCLDPADGKELWAVNVLERFGGRNITWGISECLLVDGPRVIVTPGGRKALMAALDRKTGETVWATEPVPGVTTAYASPILFELGGRRHIVSYSSHHVFGVDADAGKLLWKLPWPARRSLIGPIAALDGDAILASSSDRHGAAMVRIRLRAQADGVQAEQLWTSPLDDLHGASILLDGRLYGSGHATTRAYVCMDARTGKILYKAPGLAKGSTAYADGRLYCLSVDGVMWLLEPTAAGFQTRGQFRLVKGKKQDVWPHPVICDGRLYLRYHDKLFCYDIKRR